MSARERRTRVYLGGYAAAVLLSLLCWATAEAAEPGMAPSSSAPEVLVKKLERKRLKAEKRSMPYFQPAEAEAFFVLKRVPVGEQALPVDRYLDALEQIKRMPRHDTRTGTTVQPAAPGAATEAAVAAAGQTLGSWTMLGPGNIGGRTRALLVDPLTPTTMYAAGVAGGVWKTINGGTSWSPLTDLIANLAVNSMAMDPMNPSTIYAGTGEGYTNVDAVRGAGIFKTTDAGATWTQLASTKTPDFSFVNKLVVSPNSSQRVYAATRTGVWRSLDGGGTWVKVFNTAINGGCLDLAIRTDQGLDYMFASCGTFAQGTVYRNLDAGGAGAWTAVLGEAGMGRTSLAIARSSQGTIYAAAASIASGTFNGGLHAVFRSTDGGATWTARVRNTSPVKLNTVLFSNPVFAFSADCGFGTSQFFNQGWYDNAIAVDPADPNRVWVGGIDLFRSDDGGANWGQASHWWAASNNSRFAHADQHALVFHPQYNGTTNRTLFVGNDGGLFRTTDARAATATGPTAPCSTTNGSVSWTELNNGYGVTQFYMGVPYPGGTSYLGGAQDNGTIRGADGVGIDGWTTVFGGDGGYVAIDTTNTNVIYVETTNLSIRKSTDGGGSFVSAISGITEPGGQFLFIAPFIMDPSSSPTLWTGGFFMWRTTNGAASWTQASSILPGNGSVSAIAIAPTNRNRVLAGLSDGIIARTTIGLTSTAATAWAAVQPRAGYVSSLTFDPTSDLIAYATYSTFGGTHVFKSADGGATWAGIDGSGVTAIPDVPVHSLVVDPTNTARLYVGTDLGVFVSRDGGASWAVENTGFANVITEWLTLGSVSGTPHVFAFTHGRGAWRVPTAGAVQGSLSGRVTLGTGGLVGVTVTLSGPAVATTMTDATGAYSFAALADGSYTVTPSRAGCTFTPANRVVSVAGAGVGGQDFVAACPTKDLVITGLTVAPASVAAGGSVTPAYSVRNQGTATVTETYTERIYLSTNALRDAGDVLLVTTVGHTADLASGATLAHSQAATIPAGTAPGAYFLLVEADALGAVVEGDETNNVTAVGLTVTAPPGGKDLVITGLSLSAASVAAGGTVTVTHLVQNQGTVTVTETYTERIYLSTNQTLDAADVVLGTTPGHTATLGAGATLSNTQAVTIPAGTAAGSYFVLVQADVFGAVAETNETNQVSAVALTVTAPTGGKDLVISQIIVSPTSVPAGGSVAVTHVVRNQGTVTVTETYTERAFLSANLILDALDPLLGQTPGHTTALRPGATLTLTGAVTIPAGTAPGNYFLIIQADALGAVVEVNEANNLTAVLLTVSSPSPTEIIMDNMPPGQPPGSGRSFTGQWCLSQAPDFYGTESMESCGNGLDTYRWTPPIAETGAYEVYVWWTSEPARSHRAEIVVTHQGGVSQLFADQRTGGGQWQLLGVFPFQAGDGGSVEMLAPRNQRVSADAVRFLRVPPPPP